MSGGCSPKAAVNHACLLLNCFTKLQKRKRCDVGSLLASSISRGKFCLPRNVARVSISNYHRPDTSLPLKTEHNPSTPLGVFTTRYPERAQTKLQKPFNVQSRSRGLEKQPPRPSPLSVLILKRRVPRPRVLNPTRVSQDEK